MGYSVRLKLLSPLEKIFRDSCVGNVSFDGFSMLKNERASFQGAYTLEGDQEIDARLEIESPLAGWIQACSVGLIPAASVAPENSDDYYITKEGGDFPDVLYPVENGRVRLKTGGTYGLWFEIHGQKPLPAGVFSITIRLKREEELLASAALRVEVIDAELPKQSLIFTNWFHTDCLAGYYHVPVFSRDYWRITENYLKRAGEFGMNMVLTPVFTPPLDTQVGGERPTVQLVEVTVTGKDQYSFTFSNFDRWVLMCRRCGIEYFEISHFFTQWGAEHAPKVIALTPEGENGSLAGKRMLLGKNTGNFCGSLPGHSSAIWRSWA